MAAGSAEGGDLGRGTAATERGISGANRVSRIEALLAVWRQVAWGGDERVLTSESLRVKEPAFLEPAFLELRQIPNRGRNRLRGLATNVPPTAFGIMTAKRA